jgi:EH domain-containing protein 1
MNRESFINRLRTDLLAMVEDHLTPVALKYGYSEAPLETNIKWKPLVLVIGNYSSGKSTLINDFLGSEIQATGQAPTDDSFTVITYDPSTSPDGPIRVTEERDGKFLLNDPEYPFEALKNHGQRFASHFRLKKVNAPFLRNLSVIDTPGMLDSITERDRGYDYQKVIGDLAQIADLVLVLFDSHKAGTVREAHTSLRDTLPSRTFEDRVLFVLNRIDECVSLVDLLQVYGTLCWNLSQITGRKDIPSIHLTYSPGAIKDSPNSFERDLGFLKYLENQRAELKKAIMMAPRHRLDHLATFVETHAERLSHLIQALMAYQKRFQKYKIRNLLVGFVVAVLGGALAEIGLTAMDGLPAMDAIMMHATGGLAFVMIFLAWFVYIKKLFFRRFRKRQLMRLDTLTPLESQTRRDSWDAVQDLVAQYIKKTAGQFSRRDLKKEYDSVLHVLEQGAREIREALNELAAIHHDDAAEVDKWIDRQSNLLKETRK